mmetsp:Transcript_38885/g.62795  ORF Transcript_38885/g.62795 Transcript_38885/m.62795 type:complete len:265 (+) Transcript_38885:969-1763(+)
MRLLHLVEKHQAVRLPADAICQLTLLVVPNVARRAADQLGNCVPLHVLTHVQANHGFLLSEVGCCKGLAELGLTHTGGPAEDKGRDRAVRILQTSASTADSLGNSCHGFCLTDDAAVQRLLELNEAAAFVRGDLLDGHAGPLRNHLSDICFGDEDLFGSSVLGLLIAIILLCIVVFAIQALAGLGDQFFDLQPELGLLLLQVGGILVVLVAHGLLLLLLDLLQLILCLPGFIRHDGRLAKANAGTSLIQHVNGLVWQEAVLDVL